METRKRGAFIVFEGCDRVGKSTQSDHLFQQLSNEGIKVKKIHFPDRSTIIGKLINDYLKNSEDLSHEVIHLLFSANRWESLNSIRDDLLAGTTIICDRYAYSGVAYSVAKGLDLEWCWAPDLGLLKPDVVFYLKTQIDVLPTRTNFGTERYEKVDLQQKVSEIFDRFSEKESSYWHQVDANQSQQELFAQITAKARKVLLLAADKPLEKLK